MPTVRGLKARLRELADLGHTNRFGGAARLSATVGGLTGRATTNYDRFDHNVDSVVLASVACGDQTGLLGVVCQGNEKHEPCAVSSGLVALAFLDAFGEGVLSEADIVPGLRRAVLTAHTSILEIQEDDQTGFAGETVAGRRQSLAGIGSCATAALTLPDTLYLAQVGDSVAHLDRGGTMKQLTVPHLLTHEPGFRAHVADKPEHAAHGNVCVLSLGFGPDPEPRVTKLPLERGDQIVISNAGFQFALEGLDAIPHGATSACDDLAERMRTVNPWSPATVIVLEAR